MRLERVVSEGAGAGAGAAFTVLPDPTFLDLF